MGWGNGFGGGYNGNGGGFLGADVQRGFDQSALVNGQQNILTALNNNQMVKPAEGLLNRRPSFIPQRRRYCDNHQRSYY